MGEKLEIIEIIRLLNRRKAMILFVFFSGIFLAALISYFIMSPVYQSSTQILVSQETGEEIGLSERGVQADLQLVNTYRELIESPVIMGKVIEQLRLNTTVEELKNQFTITSNAESQLIKIAVSDHNQRQAADIANTTALIFQEEVRNILNVNNVKILFPATLAENNKPISPSPVMNMAIGGVLGLFIGVALAFFFAYLDTSIRDEGDVEKHLGLPLLAVISQREENEIKKEITETEVVLMEKEA